MASSTREWPGFNRGLPTPESEEPIFHFCPVSANATAPIPQQSLMDIAFPSVHGLIPYSLEQGILIPCSGLSI